MKSHSISKKVATLSWMCMCGFSLQGNAATITVTEANTVDYSDQATPQGVRTEFMQIGNSGSSIGQNSLVIGSWGSAIGDSSLSINANVTGNNSIGLGSATVSGIGSIGGGPGSTSGTNSIGFTDFGGVSGHYSIAVGYGARASGNASIAIGDGLAQGQYSAAIGTSSAYGFNSVALGLGNFSVGSGNIAVGKYNDPGYTGTLNLYTWAPQQDPNLDHPSDHLFVVGNGSAWNNRSNALVIYGSGNADLNGDVNVSGALNVQGPIESNGSPVVTETSFSSLTAGIGSQGTLTNTGLLALGIDSASAGYQGTAIGRSVTSSGPYSHARGFNTTSLGAFSRAEGANSESIGPFSRATGVSSKALGTHSRAEGNFTIATTDFATVFGKYNQIIEDELFVLGNGTSGTARSNAFSVQASGNTSISGNLSTAGSIATENQLSVTRQNGPTLGIAFRDADAYLKVSNGPNKILVDPNQFYADSPDFFFQGASRYIFDRTELSVGRNAADKSNLRVYGNTRLEGDVIITKPQGDISMGIFGQ